MIAWIEAAASFFHFYYNEILLLSPFALGTEKCLEFSCNRDVLQNKITLELFTQGMSQVKWPNPFSTSLCFEISLVCWAGGHIFW